MKKFSINDFLEIKSAHSASFSPDGKNVAYLSNESGTFQLYLITAKGGKSQQLTAYDDSIDAAVFSPTEQKILFQKAQGGNERGQLYLYDLKTKATESLTDKPEAIHRFGGWSRDGVHITYASNERNGTDFDIYIMEVATKKARRVFDKGGWCKAAGFSPSGTKLAVVQMHTFLSHDLFLVDIERGTAERITPHKGHAEYGSPQWLPDESAFFFLTNQDKDFINLARYDIAKKTWQYVLTPAWDIDEVSVSDNGKYVSIVVNEEGYGRLALFSAKNLRKVSTSAIPKGVISDIGFSRDEAALVFTLNSSAQSSDVWTHSIKENVSKRLTKTAQGVPSSILVDPKLVGYVSHDGLNVPAFLYLPKKLPTGPKIPVIVNIHGGPEGQYRPSFNSLVQYFVYRGYAVIAPNVRGSSGYGKKYLALDDIEKRMDSVTDLKYLHRFIEKNKKLDAKKVALMGEVTVVI